MSLRTQLQGTGVALVTPFKTNTEVDFDALEKLLDFVITNGVEYVITLGTTGETPTLDLEEKHDIINFTYEKVNGRVPVVVGIGGNNTKEVMENLQSYPLEKATAVLSASPYYNKPSQEGIFSTMQTWPVPVQNPSYYIMCLAVREVISVQPPHCDWRTK